MLCEFARWLQQFESLFGLFNYVTFRSILAALTALFLSLWIG
ncbi:phospho-N-acetylmuramoyl-pentapeptide-transferase, partial [Xylella fastidiosa subsp. multiplex]|nr:phospho-N-acetylmuramoyl-pentapeptide-transferase [Xylella fastidiosa subsp. multiplex]